VEVLPLYPIISSVVKESAQVAQQIRIAAVMQSVMLAETAVVITLTKLHQALYSMWNNFFLN